MKVYRSRISIILAVIMGISCIIFTVATFRVIEKSILLFLALNILYWGVIYICFDIKYFIIENNLIIKSGFIKMSSIDINQIKSIEKSNSILSSPAASRKRISIKYGKYDDILVSPRNQEDFIQELLKINPDIKLIDL